MAVNVDDVYQKVLVLANKEQRGYITPQEFNRLASRAQLEIFNNYFNDAKTAYHKAKNDSNYSDELDMISEKLNVHRSSLNSTFSASGLMTLQSDIKLSTIHYSYPTGSGYRVEFEEVDAAEFNLLVSNPLSRPTADRPIYTRVNANTVKTWPQIAAGTAFSYEFYNKPTDPNWAYVVVNGKALYNQNVSSDFDLHWSEEEALVSKIAEMAGITLNKIGLAQTMAQVQQRQSVEDNN